MVRHQYASVLSLTFWRALWSTMRPYLLFISGAAGLVGLAFLKKPDSLRIVLGFVPLFLSYGLGQALTDCFQMDTDALSSPYRPLVRGIVSPRQVMTVSLLGLTACVIILAYLNPVIMLPGILAVIGLLTYTILKRTWWGGPPWNAWIVALLPIMGRLVDVEWQPRTLFRLEVASDRALLFAVAAIFFGYANFVVMGYFKDISADRAAGYHTFPVVYGWRPTAVYSDCVAVLAALFTGLVLFEAQRANALGIIVFSAALGTNLYAQIKIHLIDDERQSHGPIANVVRAFILYCGAMILTLHAAWVVFFAVFYGLFELALKFRPERSQV